MKRYTILKSEIYEKGGGSAMSAARPYPKNYEVAPRDLLPTFALHIVMHPFHSKPNNDTFDIYARFTNQSDCHKYIKHFITDKFDNIHRNTTSL